MSQCNQNETSRTFKILGKILDSALLILLMANAGCKLVDGQDPGNDSIILNSMAVSAVCSTEAVVAESYSCNPEVSISEEVDFTQLTWELTAEHTCSWLQINPTTGQLFGVAPRDQIGSCVMALRVVTIEEPSSDFVQPLTILGPRISFIDKNCPLTVPVDSTYQCDIEATSPLVDAQFTYNLAPATTCSWAVINPSTGAISGTPVLGSVGSCRLSVVAEIDSIASAVSQFTVTVPAVAVSVSHSCGLNVSAGATYSCAPKASAPIASPQFTWSLSPTNTCVWASIAPATGVVSGTPVVHSTGPCRLDFMARLPNGSFGQSSVTVTVSPMGYTQNQLMDLNADSNERTGRSVAIDGNFAVIGSPSDDGGAGSVSVYQFDGASWRKNAVFASPDPKLIKSFGYTVAISGNSILVGAPDSSVSQFKEGAVVAYDWTGSSWTQTQIITPSSPTNRSQMHFGANIDIDGTQALVASSHFNTDAAYILNKVSSRWTVGASLTFAAVNSANGPDRVKVALHGSVAIVSDTHGSVNQNGEVRVFKKVNGTWNPDGILASTSSGTFGASVDTFNGKILIGTPGERSSAGTAYLYESGQNAWIQTKAFRAIDESADQRCGTGVSLNASQAVIGCAATSKLGSVYVYSLQASAWNLSSKFIPTNAQTADLFGNTVGISGRHILIGAEQFDGFNTSNSGTAYIFSAK